MAPEHTPHERDPVHRIEKAVPNLALQAVHSHQAPLALSVSAVLPGKKRLPYA